VLIRPTEDTLVLHTLFYVRELRKENRHRESIKVDRKELDLAKSLIKQLAAPFKPAEFQDSYRQNVEMPIQQKRYGETISEVERPSTGSSDRPDGCLETQSESTPRRSERYQVPYQAEG
jgi:DNA end-binding protein Ku